MEVHLLRTFVTVARRGSFSAAAAELGYTQAAVSQQIASLEADLKTQLLTRRPVAPTEAGARLLEHAGPILLRLDAARADVTRLTAAPAAVLTIGVTPLAATATALAAGLAALGDPLAEQAPVTAVGLGEVPPRIVLPPGHPLAARPALRLTDLADARWIEAPDVAPPLAEIRRLAGADGFRPALRYGGQDTATLIRLATQGHGLTLLPESSLTQNGLVTVPVTAPRLSHRTELIHTALPENTPAAALAALLTGEKDWVY